MAGIPAVSRPAFTDTSFSQPIARELVHRQSVSEVFVTSVGVRDDGSYSVFAQWPRWHVFYGSRCKRFDSALVVETLRQLTVVIAHTQLHVPLGMHFLMSDMSVSLDRDAASDPWIPTDVSIEAVVSHIRKKPGGTASFRTTAVFVVAGHRVAEGTAGARILDPSTYSRLRRDRKFVCGPFLDSVVSASQVGHVSARNVVLGENASLDCWPLHVDVTNPILFDHPLDHVPGVLLIEAVRQALRLRFREPSLDFQRLDARFLSITELGEGAEVVVEAVAAEDSLVKSVVSIRSGGAVTMRAIVETSRSVSPGFSS